MKKLILFLLSLSLFATTAKPIKVYKDSTFKDVKFANVISDANTFGDRKDAERNLPNRLERKILIETALKLLGNKSLSKNHADIISKGYANTLLKGKGFISKFGIKEKSWKENDLYLNVYAEVDSSVIRKHKKVLIEFLDTIESQDIISKRDHSNGLVFTYILRYNRDGSINLSDEFLKYGMYKQAIPELERRIKEDHSVFDQDYRDLGLCFLNTSRYNEALSNFKKAHKMKCAEEKTEGSIYDLRGYDLNFIAKAYIKLNKPNEALKAYKEYIFSSKYQRNKYQALEYLDYITSNNIKQEFPRAIEHLLSFGILEYEAMHFEKLIKLLILNDREIDAIKWTKKFANKTQDEGKAFNYGAWELYLNKSKSFYPQAIDLINQAIIYNSSPTYYNTRGRLFYELKDTTNAIRDLNRHISTASNEKSKKYALENIELVKKLGGTPAQLPGDSW